MGVVGDGIPAMASFTFALISALYTLEDVRADRRDGSCSGSFIFGVDVSVGDSFAWTLLFLILRLS